MKRFFSFLSCLLFLSYSSFSSFPVSADFDDEQQAEIEDALAWVSASLGLGKDLISTLESPTPINTASYVLSLGKYISDMTTLALNAEYRVKAGTVPTFASSCGVYIVDGTYYIGVGSFVADDSPTFGSNNFTNNFNVLDSPHGYISGFNPSASPRYVVKEGSGYSNVTLRSTSPAFVHTFCLTEPFSSSVGVIFSDSQAPPSSYTVNRQYGTSSNAVTLRQSYFSIPGVTVHVPSGSGADFNINDWQDAIDTINQNYPDILPSDRFPDIVPPLTPSIPSFTLPPDLPSNSFPVMTVPDVPSNVLEKANSSISFHFDLLDKIANKFNVSWLFVLMLLLSLFLYIIAR